MKHVLSIVSDIRRPPVQLDIAKLPSINIIPAIRTLSVKKTSQVSISSVLKTVDLSCSKPTITCILPAICQPQFHPNIVEACKMIYGKLPNELTDEENEHFNGYKQWKIDNGEPIEEDFVYNPSWASFRVLGYVGHPTQSAIETPNFNVAVLFNNVHKLYC